MIVTASFVNDLLAKDEEYKTSDIVFIKNLKCQAIIGIHSKERVRKQPIVIDLEIFINSSLQTAALRADINLTIDYEDIYYQVLAKIKNNFFLLESLAEEIALFCLDYQKVKAVRVSVRKSKIFKLSNAVGVSIFRKK